MKTTVIYHSADFDGIFCREIARKFLPEAELIGWDYGNPKVPMPTAGPIYILDLSPECVEGLVACDALVFPEALRVVWIDHHASAIKRYRFDIPGYRIDGVAACRLAWQWFVYEACAYDPHTNPQDPLLPIKEDYIGRQVLEPSAVRLAGEYDIWDKRDPNAELFQHGLRSRDLETLWPSLLTVGDDATVRYLLERGEGIQYAQTRQNESIIKAAGFTIEFEGLKFLACNHARYNSHLFAAGLTPDHDGCFGFAWRDGHWNVSLYHAPGKEHHDLSQIAVKYGGGGHRGACGFRIKSLPFLS